MKNMCLKHVKSVLNKVPIASLIYVQPQLISRNHESGCLFFICIFNLVDRLFYQSITGEAMLECHVLSAGFLWISTVVHIARLNSPRHWCCTIKDRNRYCLVKMLSKELIEQASMLRRTAFETPVPDFILRVYSRSIFIVWE